MTDLGLLVDFLRKLWKECVLNQVIHCGIKSLGWNLKNTIWALVYSLVKQDSWEHLP